MKGVQKNQTVKNPYDFIVLTKTGRRMEVRFYCESLREAERELEAYCQKSGSEKISHQPP